ncbi:hypothetical protein HK097_011438 [Rhizophlyctis rosea]|uniref:t-SNARE coiled-coil homology domain-containing protein n=1 Tax=Rhizophlyctis rosea TaxID=64517 RepID=A0AAD5SED4_9FUNG|nr:hypothetical protein HK097_011438 [Rhizophlyctis rosea]
MAGSLGTRDASVASPFGSYDESTANVHHQRLNEHRHAIVWMLQNRLMQVSRVQKEMQERRLEQRVQKQERSDEEGFRTPASGAMTPLEQEVASNKAQGQSEEENVELHLSEQERIFLENENAVMLAELESDLDQVRNATQSLQEIANLQTQMAHHLQTQQETIETLYQEAWTSNQTLENANKMLVKASKNFGDTRLWVLMFLLIASAVLLFLDYYG